MGVDDFWEDDVVTPPVHNKVKRKPPVNRPRPGELDVKIYEVSHRTGFAFCNAWDYANHGYLIGKDGISPVQVAIHIRDINATYPQMLKEGARFRVIPSKTRPDSTFEYFGKIVSPI